MFTCAALSCHGATPRMSHFQTPMKFPAPTPTSEGPPDRGEMQVSAAGAQFLHREVHALISYRCFL